MKQFILIIALASVGTWSSDAQDLAGHSATFVDVGFGARAVALGASYVGLADDAHAVFWNPSGLAQAEDYQISLGYLDHLGMFPYQHLALAIPLGANDGVGLGVISSGDDALSELTIQGAYGRVLGPLMMGATVKYRNASFGDNTLNEADYVVFEESEIQAGLNNQVTGTASGFGFDLGLLYRPTPSVSFGMAFRDAIAPLSWSSAGGLGTATARGDYSESLPSTLSFGTAYRPTTNAMISVDYSPATASDVADRLGIGAELQVFDVLFLRGGTMQLVNGDPDERYALGFGLDVGAADLGRIRADYTYSIQKLANTQQFSLSVSF
jgi:hypothetical protein